MEGCYQHLLGLLFVLDIEMLGTNLLAFLYADPGSGMLVWQLLTAVILGSLFHIKTIARKIREAIKNRREGSAIVRADDRS